MRQHQKIILKNVKVHNLKNVDLTLDHYQLIVFTGVSGSGKSSMAFDTIFNEGQRRYIDSLSHNLRRYLPSLTKPNADLIAGLSPTIAIEQKTIAKTPRSTVGTMTAIYDYLRVLYAKIGEPYCPVSQEKVKAMGQEKIIKTIEQKFKDTEIIVLASLCKQKKGDFQEDLNDQIKKGYLRARIDGAICELGQIKPLDEKKAHDIEIVIDRISLSDENIKRAHEAIISALRFSKGSVIIFSDKKDFFFSEYGYSPKSDLYYGPLEAKDFSFNHPSGMCEKCHGLGEVFEFDLDKIADVNLSVKEDCCYIAPRYNTVRYKNIYDNLAKKYHFNVAAPWKELSEKAKTALLYGTKEKWTKMRFHHPQKKRSWIEFVKWEGIIPEAHKRLIEAQSPLYKQKMQKLMVQTICPLCHGAKIKPYPANVRLLNKKIAEISSLTIEEALLFFETASLSLEDFEIGKDLITEIKKKLRFLQNVGLHYLTLDRSSQTLSGGEAQRVRLAAQMGCGLSGATYILDEPSIGLHPVDNEKLLRSLKTLQALKNTIIVVEHDKETILSADTIVDFGPFAGKDGGEIVFQGTANELVKHQASITGQYLSKKRSFPDSKERKPSDKFLTLKKASLNNLKEVDLSLPLHTFIGICGVSGSGKSSLISDTLYPAVFNHLNNSNLKCGKYEKLEGMENINKVIFIDQSPIGRTIRSNCATYTKLFDDIRDFYTELPESKIKGFSSGIFSFNVKDGSCPYCKGLGQIKVDLDFLEEASTPCPQCKGKRFDPETLSIEYKGKNIFDALQMSVDEACINFENIYPVKQKLALLQKVGLGYLPIGQPATTLSGGEAQRIKLAKELIKPGTGKTLYILDEPTSGLHFYDIDNLLNILQTLVDNKNTVVVIEHNLDFLKTVDWLIELGPKAGKEGGKIIAEGAVKKISNSETPTSYYLKKDDFQLPKTAPPNIETIEKIKIKHASQYNLKQISLDIPHNAICVFTGPSGSGKTTLAIDTIHAEAQLRYMEALPSYTRQFLKEIPKPQVESIDNLLPSIAIEQQGHLLSPRSTIGTVTEIYDHLRLLFAYAATFYCPETGEEIKNIGKEYVLEKILTESDAQLVKILAPVAIPSDKSFEQFAEKLKKQGFLKIRLNQVYYDLDEKIDCNPTYKNELLLVIDRVSAAKENANRILDALQTAANLSNNIIHIESAGKDRIFNLSFAVESSGKSYPPVTFHTFSFNSDDGMCLECQGLGYIYGGDFFTHPLLKDLSLKQLAKTFMKDANLFFEYLKARDINPKKSLFDLSPSDLNLVLNGDKKPFNYQKGVNLYFKGLTNTLSYAAKHFKKEIRDTVVPLMETFPCPICKGGKLNPIARSAKLNNVKIQELSALPLDKALLFFENLTLSKNQQTLLKESLEQIKMQLKFLIEIGLSYLSLDRTSPTLSGGEMQRIKLAKLLKSGLSNCIYIFDEPTIGLHPHDSYLLINALKKLKNMNNTLILVEHDPLVIQQADFIVDFGPKSGQYGGKIIAKGAVSDILKDPNSITGEYLSRRKQIPPLTKTSPSFNKGLIIKNATLHNLKNISVEIPLNQITCISGVSGSGKSTLIFDILKKGISKRKNDNEDSVAMGFARISGLNQFASFTFIDQSPIGQTSRADVSTYTEVLPLIRSFFATLPLAKTRGWMPRNFSFNHISGMCRTCWGLGHKTVNLHYLPSVKTACNECNGFKLNPVTFDVKYKEKHLGEILKLNILEAKELFSSFPKIQKKLDLIVETGLEYLTLGQDLNTLSLGEQQRLRLVKELSKSRAQKTLYVFDEPTTGLHFADISNLLKIFEKLKNKKNTLLIIEHNLSIIKNADYLIELGPGGGENGGHIIFRGTTEKAQLDPNSITGKYLNQSFLSI